MKQSIPQRVLINGDVIEQDKWEDWRAIQNYVPMKLLVNCTIVLGWIHGMFEPALSKEQKWPCTVEYAWGHSFDNVSQNMYFKIPRRIK